MRVSAIMPYCGAGLQSKNLQAKNSNNVKFGKLDEAADEVVSKFYKDDYELLRDSDKVSIKFNYDLADIALIPVYHEGVSEKVKAVSERVCAAYRNKVKEWDSKGFWYQMRHDSPYPPQYSEYMNKLDEEWTALKAANDRNTPGYWSEGGVWIQ